MHCLGAAASEEQLCGGDCTLINHTCRLVQYLHPRRQTLESEPNGKQESTKFSHSPETHLAAFGLSSPMRQELSKNISC